MANEPALRPPEKVLNDKKNPESKITTPPTSNFMNNNNNDTNNKENENTSEEGKKSKTIENDTLMAKTPKNEDTDTAIIEQTLQLAT